MNDPHLLKNIIPLTEAIQDAIENGKMITIFADNDPDGICSTAIMYNYIKKFTKKVQYFHAQRSDGHGIEIAKHLVPSDTELLIIVDSSSNDVEACKELSEKRN